MRRFTSVMVLGLVAFVGSQIAGCGVIQIPVPFELNTDAGGNGSFEVEADTPSTNAFTTNFDTSQYTVGSGSVVLDPDDITVTPDSNAPGKFAPRQQSTSVLEITVTIGAADLAGTICDAGVGETYGPFSVTLDENYVPVSIDPSSVTLSATTVALLNQGQFAVCLEVVSPVTGTVKISGFTLLLTP